LGAHWQALAGVGSHIPHSPNCGAGELEMIAAILWGEPGHKQSGGLFVPGEGGRLQRPQRARLVVVGVRLGQVGLPRVLHQQPTPREQLHQPGDDRLQQRMHLVAGGRTHFDELRHAIGTTPVHPVQQQAVQVDVQVERRAEALDQRDGAAMAFVGLEPGEAGTTIDADASGIACAEAR
jgi:hypothetical protein